MKNEVAIAIETTMAILVEQEKRFVKKIEKAVIESLNFVDDSATEDAWKEATR